VLHKILEVLLKDW